MKLLNWQMVNAVQEGTLTPQDALPPGSRCTAPRPARDASPGSWRSSPRPGVLKEGSTGAVLHGELERGYRSAVIFTFGGDDEIQREIISSINWRYRGSGVT